MRFVICRCVAGSPPPGWRELVREEVVALEEVGDLLLAGEKPLLTVQLYSFIGQYGPQYGNLMASALLVAAPPVILFLILQRYLISGLTAGAVKE
jgi:ABC-type maltose transport system permease subunit